MPFTVKIIFMVWSERKFGDNFKKLVIAINVIYLEKIRNISTKNNLDNN